MTHWVKCMLDRHKELILRPFDGLARSFPLPDFEPEILKVLEE